MKTSTREKLIHRQHQLIFVSAPAGLGHLRVTDALFQRLPEAVNPVVLGSEDRSIQTIHRITSSQPVARGIFEWLQSGPFSSLSNRLYRRSLRSQTDSLYREVVRLIDQRYAPLTQIWVVATHFGLAHQLAAFKEKLQREKNVAIRLAVIVTDDSFQHIWYVDGADVIVVPSRYIQKQYLEYGKQFGGRERVEVLPYPMSVNFKKKLSAGELRKKKSQFDPQSNELIQVSLPVSGAAVGTDFLLRLMNGLRENSKRFHFHVVSKDAPYTKDFLRQTSKAEWISIHSAATDRGVVEMYDQLLDKNVIALEVTKPSEQSFKACFSAAQRGGVILLFSEPVGQQEFENLAFLERNTLLPSLRTHEALWEMAEKDIPFDTKNGGVLLKEATEWRAIRLPSASEQAAHFIWWMQTTGVFSKMALSTASGLNKGDGAQRTGEDDVDRFWDLVASL